MPFYEYECASCGHQAEVLQKISDPPLRKCPDCGKQALKRLISAPVFRLAGGGWYETDFKTDKENKRNLVGREESGTEAKSESAKSESGSTNSKPAASADSSSDKSAHQKSESTSKKSAESKPAAAKPRKKAAASG